MNVTTRPSLPRPQVSGLHGEAGPLALYDWTLPASKPLGTVILVHGLGEHAGRYGEVAAHLHQWGFAVRAYDQQGHGQSEGARGDMLRPGSLQADLCRVIDDTRQRPSLQGTPLILLGHSLGGLVVAGSVKRTGVAVDFMVTDTAKSVPVHFEGILPDLFKEGKGVVAQGKLQDGVFVAKEVLAKHDENYMPPEAAEALKNAAIANQKAATTLVPAK